MPVFAVLIVPLLALYKSFKVVAIAVKIAMFVMIYFSFKTVMEWGINTLMTKLGTVGTLPPMVAWILDQLQIMTMVNFGLSFLATIYIGKFFYSSITKIL